MPVMWDGLTCRSALGEFAKTSKITNKNPGRATAPGIDLQASTKFELLGSNCCSLTTVVVNNSDCAAENHSNH